MKENPSPLSALNMVISLTFLNSRTQEKYKTNARALHLHLHEIYIYVYMGFRSSFNVLLLHSTQHYLICMDRAWY